jgi:hypothetical protein
MGLDIYLYKYENYLDTKRREDIYEKESSLYWEKAGKKYDEMTEEEKDEINEMDKKLAEKLNLDKYGEDETLKKQIEIDYAQLFLQ